MKDARRKQPESDLGCFIPLALYFLLLWLCSEIAMLLDIYDTIEGFIFLIPAILGEVILIKIYNGGTKKKMSEGKDKGKKNA